MSGLLAQTGVNATRLEAVARHLNRRAKSVHEIFATTISIGVLGVEKGQSLLSGNRRYLRYLEQGLDLGGDPTRWPWQFRESAAQMLLRALMQPRELMAIAEVGFDRLSLQEIERITPPDIRLFRAAAAGSWWDDTFSRLLIDDPTRGGDAGDAWSRGLPTNSAEMDQLKAYEEGTLIPALAEAVRPRLASLGVHVLDEAEYLHVVEFLRASFTALAPDEWQIELLTDRRSMSQEPLGAERERIYIHHMPATAEIVSINGLDDAVFVHQDLDGRPAILATYLQGSSYATQFGITELSGQPVVLALAGRPHLDSSDKRHVPLALLAPPMTPEALHHAFTRMPVIVLTSLTVTRDRQLRDEILSLPTAFVLMDLPLNLQVSYWANDGWTVRFTAIDLQGAHDLTLLLFQLEQLPSLYFISYRTLAGFGEIAQILDRYPNNLSGGLAPEPKVIRQVMLVTNWLMAAWWRFQEAENF
ncbi:MAG: hypothetical protein QM619_13020 [Micropruina sp.]|uniref:hypothetical protein n=1 Tax=Micropruina sp. TaxID=2737536 RepID=UPI0039E565C7